MTQISEYKPSGRQKAAGIALALLSGIVAPVAPYLGIGAVMMTFLFAYAGMAPLIVCACVQLFVASLMGNTMLVTMVLVSNVLPAVAIARGVQWRKPFFEQMRLAIALQLGGIVAAVAVAYFTYGSDIIGKFIDMYHQQLLDSSAEVIDAVLAMMTGNSAYLNGFADDAERLRVLNGTMQELSTTLKLQAPGILLSGAAGAAVIMVTWANWLVARRGFAANDSYVPLALWRLPAHIVIGAIGTYIVVATLYLSGYVQGIDALVIAVENIVAVCFAAQGAAALSRRMAAFRISAGKRNIAIALLLIFFQFVVAYIGVASALFGSQGIVTQLMRRRRGGD